MDPIAVCYLGKEGDNKNRCLLYPDHLVISKDGRDHHYDLEQHLTFGFERRKWMLPLIFGSIGSAISLLLVFRYVFNPYVTITLLLFSILAIYFGFEGSEVMVVRSKGLTNIFPIIKRSSHLLEFVHFVREYVQKKLEGDGQMLIYHITSSENWKLHQYQDKYLESSLKTVGFIHCSKKDQVVRSFFNYFGEDKHLVLLTINPLKLSSQLKYDPAPKNNELFPHIYGPINMDAIVTSTPFMGQAELNALINN